MFTLKTTTDESGAIYLNDAMSIGEFSTMADAFGELKIRMIDGIRGPGCFSISDPAGNNWDIDPRGMIGDIFGMVRINDTGEIVDEWRA